MKPRGSATILEGRSNLLGWVVVLVTTLALIHKIPSDPRGVAGDGWIPHKDRDLGFHFQYLEVKLDRQSRELVSEMEERAMLSVVVRF